MLQTCTLARFKHSSLHTTSVDDGKDRTEHESLMFTDYICPVVRVVIFARNFLKKQEFCDRLFVSGCILQKCAPIAISILLLLVKP